MRAGGLTEIIVLLKPQVTTDKYGAEQTIYTEVKRIHADVAVKGTSTAEEVGEMFTTYRTDILIRDQHEIAEKWRIKWMRNGMLFNVNSVIPDPANMLNRLVCERVNE